MAHENPTFQMECLSLSVSLFSTYCAMNHVYLIPCANIVGLRCIADLYYLKNKDMILHHILVLLMIHHMNAHDEIEIVQHMTAVLLSTKISTIFLTMNSLLDMKDAPKTVKHLNQICFVISFLYYRIYKYSYFILDTQVNHTIWVNSRNHFEFSEICIGIYGIFLLNMYWCVLILNKVNRTIRGQKQKKLP